MAYSAPELLLVGAAQNLVLASSDINAGKFQNPCLVRPTAEADDQLQYDNIGLW